MATENLGTVTASPTEAPPATPVATNTTIQADTYQDMLNILEELVTHTHIFYDDYTTACNCNCNCNCTRGIL